LGSVLRIKPILTLKSGCAEQFDKVRTHRRAISRLSEPVVSQAAQKGDAYISIMYSSALKLSQAFYQIIWQVLHIINIPILDLPPGLYTHRGPGILTVGFFTDEQ
jgi:fatty acid-binding protein DegV